MDTVRQQAKLSSEACLQRVVRRIQAGHTKSASAHDECLRSQNRSKVDSIVSKSRRMNHVEDD